MFFIIIIIIIIIIITIIHFFLYLINLFSIFISSRVIYSPAMYDLDPRILQTKCPLVRYLWRSHRLWTRSLDKDTRSCLPESVVSRMSDHCPRNDTGRNTNEGQTPNPRIEIKIPTPPGTQRGCRVGRHRILPTTPHRRTPINPNTGTQY